jgi:hypothetical protein
MRGQDFFRFRYRVLEPEVVMTKLIGFPDRNRQVVSAETGFFNSNNARMLRESQIFALAVFEVSLMAQ